MIVISDSDRCTCTCASTYTYINIHTYIHMYIYNDKAILEDIGFNVDLYIANQEVETQI